MNKKTLITAYFLLLILFGRLALAQDAIFYKFPYGNTPVIDGKFDPLWYEVGDNYLDLSDQFFTDAGLPTLGVATWRGAWNDTAVFVIITVEDDDFYPHYEAGGQLEWEYDKPEIYIDVNAGELDDGLSPKDANSGHYQFAPGFVEGNNPYFSDGNTWFGCYLASAYEIVDPNYVYEYAFNISDLLDKHGSTFNPTTEPIIGFEITIIDRDAGDAGRRFAVWKNIGENGSSWDNMDDCGEVKFSNEVISSTTTPFYRFQDGCVPVIDGIKDPVWDQTEAHNISRHYRYENPSLYEATWQAAWNDTSIFVLVTVGDDDFYPMWESDDHQWMSDKVELYFDVNEYLGDGGGPANRGGHYQIAPWFYDGAHEYYQSGYQSTGQSDVYATVAYKVNDPDYVYEYAISIQDLRDEDGAFLNPYDIDMIGFDVTIVDRDAGDAERKRAVWRNTGAINESWRNMNDCGYVTFSAKTITEFPRPEIRLKGEDILICLDSGRNSYNWYYENQHLIDETKQFLRISSDFTGNYFVSVDNEYGCRTKSNPFYFSTKSGILKNSEPVIELYPVPSRGNFRLTMSGDQSGRIIINIRDFSGKIIKSLIIDKGTGPVSEEINLLNVPKGVYMLDIFFNNEIYLKRILIN